MSNFESLTQAKDYAIQKLSEKMAELQGEWRKVIDSYNSAVQSAYESDPYGNKALEMERNALRKVEPIGEKINIIYAGIKSTGAMFDKLEETLEYHTEKFEGGKFEGGDVTKGGSGGSGSSGGGSSSSDKEKVVENLDLEIDRYYELNDLLEDYNSLISQNQELQNYANSVDKQKLLMEEIDLMKKKREVLSSLLEEQNKERLEIQKYLIDNHFKIDSMGNIINLEERLLALQSWANSQDNSNKEQAINSVKKLQEATERYTSLVNSEIPKTTQQWQQMNSAIKSSAESMLTDIRDRLVEALRKQGEEELSSKEKILDERIKRLQDEIDALDDEEGDKRKKLIKLQKELELWKQDDSPYAKKKIQELQQTIAELEKEIRKDELEQEIELAEKTREELQESYDEKLSDKSLYGEADKLLTAKNMDEIVSLITTYDETFKGLGNLLGESLADAIKLEVENAIKSLDILKNEIKALSQSTAVVTPTTPTPTPTTPTPAPSQPSNPTTSTPITKGSKVKVTNLSSPIYYTSSSGSSSGTWQGTGIVNANTPLYVVNEANGRVALSKNTSVYSAIGWIDKKNVAGFKIGGSVGEWTGGDGKLIQVHSGEGVLTAEQNKAWLKFTDILPQVSNLISGAIKNFSIKDPTETKGGDVTIHNDFKVTNNTPFDVERSEKNITTALKNELRRVGKIK